MSTSIDLQGRVAIVTGAGTGMGLAIAHELARAGADIAVLELNKDSSDAAAQALAAEHGVRTLSVPTDVADRETVDRSFEHVASEFGRLDIAVNNAGISRVGPH